MLHTLATASRRPTSLIGEADKYGRPQRLGGDNVCCPSTTLCVAVDGMGSEVLISSTTPTDGNGLTTTRVNGCSSTLTGPEVDAAGQLTVRS
jgi:hypothetical protein